MEPAAKRPRVLGTAMMEYDDLEAVLELLNDPAREMLEKNTRLLKCVERPGHFVSVESGGATAIGYLSTRHKLDVLLVYVPEEQRRRGEGVRLLRVLVEGSGSLRAFVRLQSCIRDCHGLYEKAGFVISGDRDESTLLGSWERPGGLRRRPKRRVALGPCVLCVERVGLGKA